MKQITPENLQKVFTEIAAFLRKRPVNVDNSGTCYGPVLITPKLENKPVKLTQGTSQLFVLDLCENGGSAGAVVIYPSDSKDGKTYYELNKTSLVLKQIIPRIGAHEIWLKRP